MTDDEKIKGLVLSVPHLLDAIEALLIIAQDAFELGLDTQREIKQAGLAIEKAHIAMKGLAQ